VSDIEDLTLVELANELHAEMQHCERVSSRAIKLASLTRACDVLPVFVKKLTDAVETAESSR
jgi:hypothetical protein